MKKVIITCVPLFFYNQEILYGIYEYYQGKKRKKIREAVHAGQQVSFALKESLKSEPKTKVIVFFDDKFNHQTVSNEMISQFANHPVSAMPEILQRLVRSGKILIPPESMAFSSYFFSEKKLLAYPGAFCPVGSFECSAEWMALLPFLNGEGYKDVVAYVPSPCMQALHVATAYYQSESMTDQKVVIHRTAAKRGHVQSIEYYLGGIQKIL